MNEIDENLAIDLYLEDERLERERKLDILKQVVKEAKKQIELKKPEFDVLYAMVAGK